MFPKKYGNFMKSSPVKPGLDLNTYRILNGKEDQRLYLEEVKDVTVNESSAVVESSAAKPQKPTKCRRKRTADEVNTSNMNLFLSAQRNDVDTLTEILDLCPEKINCVDDFGWSLLMVACQADSVDTVKELLRRGIDTTVRDKAGNSASTFVIKNNNLVLADILLNKSSCETDISGRIERVTMKEEYVCTICNNKKYPDKQEHLSSTVHNINSSKNRKIPAQYMIPESNRGYQIMLKVGWDKESGLGRNGCGNKYPVRAVQKLDRKGLGLKGKNCNNLGNQDSITNIHKKIQKSCYEENRKFEVDFRRQFY